MTHLPELARARVLAAGSEWAGAAPADLQRAQASQAAALLPAQSLHFQQSLWWPQASV
ncbi:MAG: hypothetical protein U5L74_00310 [Ideonella sp.]|nr:hypothetical protein [Ideonella sp.]